MYGKTVILAEKPSQAKAYADAFAVEKRDKTSITLKKCNTFPSGAIITWAIGHLVSLKMPNEYKEEWGKWNLANLPIVPDRFEFKVMKDKQSQFNAVKKLFNDADVIINACDVDREGSNIFYSILNMTGAKNKTIKRLWINSLEVDEVRKGFNNLQDNSKDLLMYNEAKTRQISDWLVGINASQLFTLLLQQKGLNTTLSVGRVQSPTVYMIYQRQKEIENFVSKPFYELFAEFTHEKGVYKGKAKIKEDDKQQVISLLEKNGLSCSSPENGVIDSVTKQLKKTKSPLLHSLSTLQTTANKRWKYSPAKVLEVMQSLYEKKLVTYPRTDCNYITDSEFEYLSNNVEEYQKLLGVSFTADKTPKKRYVDGSKVQEHYAIVMTKAIPSDSTLKALNEEEKNIYEEIIRTTLAMFHGDYEYEETTITTSVKGIEFFTKGKVEVEKGWKSLFNETDEKDKEGSEVLPPVQKGETTSSLLEVREGFTQPPKPYTEGGLINMMKTAGKLVEDEADSEILKEVEGIGTEATRSGIIETIKKNGYIEVKKNIVSVTEKGIILCEAIEGNLLSSPSMTAKWETYLRKIGEGKGSQDNFLKNIKKFLNATIDEAPKKFNTDSVNLAVKEQINTKIIGNCPVCNDGKMIDRQKFYGCSNYKNGCTFSISKIISGKKLTQKNIKDLLEKRETSKIQGFKSKTGKAFEAILTVNNDKVSFKF